MTTTNTRTRKGQKNAAGTPAAPPATPPATPPAPPANSDVTVDEIKSIVADAVSAAAPAIVAQVKAAMTAPPAPAAPPAPPAPPAPAPAEPPKVEPGSDIKSIVDNAIKAAFATHQRQNMVQDPADAQRHRVEVPTTLCKGNLPLHMKQLLNVIQRRNENDGIAAAELEVGEKWAQSMYNGITVERKGIKALTTDGTNLGSEWMPRNLSSELLRRLYLESSLAQAFMDQEIDMPTDPYDIPLSQTDGEFFLSTAQLTDAVQDDGATDKVTLTSKTFRGLRQLSDEANEDSIIPLIPTIQQSLAAAAARAYENALINGDTTATHMDTGYTVATNDIRRAWKGFRKLALDISGLKSDISSGGISRANLTATMKLLGKWGTNSKNLLWVWGPKAHASLMGLDEFALAYARGGGSTFATGAPIAAPYGGQYCVSDQIPENLNASGVYDGSTTTKGTILVLNKAAFRVGFRRKFTVEMERRARSGQWDLVASFRKAFSPVETPSATITTVAVAYNYTA